jgi:hypothetical protein
MGFSIECVSLGAEGIRSGRALMIVIPVYGVLMESLGRKVAMLTAGIFYGLGTILCATSGSMYQLIAARAVAGVSHLSPHDTFLELVGDRGDWKEADISSAEEGC